MFDFWKEVIINDASRLKEVTNAYGEKGLRVERCADYIAANVLGKKVYKTMPQKGVVAEIALPIEGAGRAIIKLGLSVGTDSEFARPWSVFKMPIVVEFDGKKTLADSLRLAVDSHIGYVKEEKDAEGKVTSAKFVLVDPRVCVEVSMEATEATAVDENGKAILPNIEVAVENKAPFGTGEWILENLRFPTHVNTYVGAPNADDMPNMGAEYIQYAFEYCVPKRGFHGQGAVGEPMSSVTHHIFYVEKNLADAADKAFGLLCEGGKVTQLDAPVYSQVVEITDAKKGLASVADLETSAEAGE